MFLLEEKKGKVPSPTAAKVGLFSCPNSSPAAQGAANIGSAKLSPAAAVRVCTLKMLPEYFCCWSEHTFILSTAHVSLTRFPRGWVSWGLVFHSLASKIPLLHFLLCSSCVLQVSRALQTSLLRALLAMPLCIAPTASWAFCSRRVCEELAESLQLVAPAP